MCLLVANQVQKAVSQVLCLSFSCFFHDMHGFCRRSSVLSVYILAISATGILLGDLQPIIFFRKPHSTGHRDSRGHCLTSYGISVKPLPFSGLSFLMCNLVMLDKTTYLIITFRRRLN